MFNGNEQTATRLPEYNSMSVGSMSVGMAKEEPDIIKAARAYDEARRELQHLQEQRETIDMGIKVAMERMDEAARHMVSIMQPSEKRAY